MKKLNLTLVKNILFIFFTIFSCHSNEILIGKAIVVDGDTIKIKNKNIRFHGIDAPESYFNGKTQICYQFEDNKKVFCGKDSKALLSSKIYGKTIKCIGKKIKDRYNRILAECYINSKSLSSFMVKSGYAFDYKKYSNGKFNTEQEYAKKNKLGMWNMKFDYPWIWRKNNK